MRVRLSFSSSCSCSLARARALSALLPPPQLCACALHPHTHKHTHTYTHTHTHTHKHTHVHTLSRARARSLSLSHTHAHTVFVSDGSKCDLGRLQFLFGSTAKIAIQDPAYPVYVDSSVMAGRTGACHPETKQVLFTCFTRTKVQILTGWSHWRLQRV
jgi:hypothetical protein